MNKIMKVVVKYDSMYFIAYGMTSDGKLKLLHYDSMMKWQSNPSTSEVEVLGEVSDEFLRQYNGHSYMKNIHTDAVVSLTTGKRVKDNNILDLFEGGIVWQITTS